MKQELLSIAGILTEDGAEVLERRIKKIRKRSRSRMKRIRKELVDSTMAQRTYSYQKYQAF